MFIIGMFLESRIYKSEYSAFKLLCRTGSILSILFLLYVFPNACTTLKYLWVTIMGYFLVSCITQYYSLFIFNKLEYKNNVEEKEEEKEEDKVEEKVEEKEEEKEEDKVEEKVEEKEEDKVEEKVEEKEEDKVEEKINSTKN
jgi:cytochrome b subunit of formate dehydrogenase